MKKQLLLVLCALICGSTLFAQATRTVLVEEFTNASCGPCAAQNPGLKTVLDANYPKVISIKYQTNFPGFDPFNAQNPTEVQNRWDFYKVFTGVPSLAVDGYAPNGAYQGSNFGYIGQPAGLKQSVLDYHVGVSTPITVSVSHKFNAKLDSISVRMVVKNVDKKEVDATTLVGQIAIIEKEVNFPAAPGGNGETDFYGIMRKMLPNAAGTIMPAKIAAGDSVVVTMTKAFPAYIYNLKQVGVVAFVQNTATKEVLNAGASEPVALPTGLVDAGLTDDTQAPTSLCAYDLTPQIKVKNEDSATPITSFVASYTLNKGKSVTKKWTGTLKPGDTQTITFPKVVVNPGETDVDYKVDSLNKGVKDYNILNNTVATFNFETIPTKPTQTEIKEDFQTAAIQKQEDGTVLINPDNNPVFVVKKAISTAATANLGGFGKSDGSYRWTFWAMEPEAEATLVFYKVNLKNRKKLSLKFSHAYAQYSEGGVDTNDQLEIGVSKDCGATFTTIFDKAGPDLKTVAPVSTKAFYPTATQWRANVVDLAKYDGTDELVFAFRGYCDFGNNLYIDDIEVTGEQIVGTNDATFEGSVSVFPNPASEQVNVSVVLDEATALNVEITDVAGRVIERIVQNESYAAGKYKMEWTPNNSGIFFVKVRSNKGEIVQKVNVVK
jgi:hypothetical protein